VRFSYLLQETSNMAIIMKRAPTPEITVNTSPSTRAATATATKLNE
jgi:hypothetical protein